MRATSSPIEDGCSSGRVLIPAGPLALGRSTSGCRVYCASTFGLFGMRGFPARHWSRSPPVSSRPTRSWRGQRHYWQPAERSIVVLRQFENLPRPLTSEQARELLAELQPPYDLMARWQLYTGLRVGELLQLGVKDVLEHGGKAPPREPTYRSINIIRKGRKPGYVIASMSLLDETAGYIAQYRAGWIKRAARTRGRSPRTELFRQPPWLSRAEEHLSASHRARWRGMRIQGDIASATCVVRLLAPGALGAAREAGRGDQPVADCKDSHGPRTHSRLQTATCERSPSIRTHYRMCSTRS